MTTEEIYAAANQLDIPLPKPVVAATTLLEAAQKLRAGIDVETAPDLTGLTPGKLPKAHEALVSWELRDARVRAADAIVKHAEGDLANTMFVNAQSLWEPLAAAFARAADKFRVALGDLGGQYEVGALAADPVRAEMYQRLQAAASDLDYLSGARDAFAAHSTKADAHSDKFERVSRCLVITDMRAFSSRPLVGRGIEYWGEAIRRGYAFRWQTVAQQVQNAADAIAAGRAA